ncbi:uncharacterized protein KQ657_004930 [Scheffersomyces spartinae]|uniref:Mannosyltransferase n=1 Tax=Scheffersomyces spartinae TaxID=45513 RepID=A0A9P8AIB7_9ASCO|nr:uncharacterized protein KQ657_004930 [Scheffersomyces spartinae]KAG7194218.1 hypothetical protein KQ657_004930 [Scheffersomyces spartinae]
MVAAACVVGLMLYFQLGTFDDKIFESALVSKFKGGYDFVQQRKQYVNPQYHRPYFQRHTVESPIDKSCQQYFRSLETFDLKYFQDFRFDRTLLKKQKWVHHRQLAYKSQLVRAGKTYEASVYDPIIEKEYEKAINDLSVFEMRLSNVLSHFRVLLNCPDADKIGEKFLNSIFPTEIIYRGDGLGNGLVIPLYEKVSVSTVASLIRVLRSLQTSHPIELVFHDLEDDDRSLLELAARDTLERIPKEFEEIVGRPFNQQEDYPPVSLMFLEVEKPNDNDVVTGDSYLFAKASLLNSFKVITMLHPDIIPLTDDFSSQIIRASNEFRETGLFMFQQPYWTHTRQRRGPSGFHEINNFIHKYLLPQKEDEIHFGIKPIESTTMKRRYFDDLFSQTIDHSMVIINKDKHKFTLYVHLFLSLIQQNDYFNTRVSQHSGLNLELLWLSSEILGAPYHVNLHAGVAVGIHTPPELANKTFKKTTQASELCSSSWGQLSEINDRLLYVQNYQLLNWKTSPGFKLALRNRYLIMGKPLQDYTSKLQLNPLWIDTALEPPFVSDPIFDKGEPSQGWNVWDSFADELAFPYYCAYNVVGDVSSGRYGRSFDFDTGIQIKVNYYANIWLHQN